MGATIEARFTNAPPWSVLGRLVVTNGKLVLAELRIFPGTSEDADAGEWLVSAADLDRVDDGGVTARLLRSVPIGELFAEYRKAARVVSSVIPLGDLDPGSDRSSDRFYAIWAARYVEALETGSRKPLVELADAWSVDRDWLRDVLHEARRRKLLTRPTERRAGGELTSAARGLLDEPVQSSQSRPSASVATRRREAKRRQDADALERERQEAEAAAWATGDGDTP